MRVSSVYVVFAAAAVLACVTADSPDDIVPEKLSTINVPEDTLVSRESWQVATTAKDVKPAAKATMVPATKARWWEVPSTELEISNEGESSEEKKKAKHMLHKDEQSAHNLLKNIISTVEKKKVVKVSKKVSTKKIAKKAQHKKKKRVLMAKKAKSRVKHMLKKVVSQKKAAKQANHKIKKLLHKAKKLNAAMKKDVKKAIKNKAPKRVIQKLLKKAAKTKARVKARVKAMKKKGAEDSEKGAAKEGDQATLQKGEKIPQHD